MRGWGRQSIGERERQPEREEKWTELPSAGLFLQKQ